MPRKVTVDDGGVRYSQIISAGRHVLRGDEPVDAGGGDTGPNPYELLLGALGLAPVSPFECMPIENNGRLRVCTLNFHMAHRTPMILRRVTRKPG